MTKLILLLLLTIASESISQTNFNLEREKTVDSILQAYCHYNEPGMAIGIVLDGKMVYKNSIGKANLSNNIPISDSTAFNIASVSKQFTAFLALIAVQEGKISLEDDIRIRLPELKNLPYKISIKQLANHTHGLPNFSDIIQLLGYNLEDPINNSQALQIMLNSKQLNFEPGAQYQYGNTGFMLLAEILSRAYEMPFQKIIDEKIFNPLEMHQSEVVGNQNTVVRNKAIAYSKRGDTFVEYVNRQMESGPSNIHTSLIDMLKWLTNFQQPTLGNREMFDEMIASTKLNDEREIEYGLGLQTETYKGLDLVFHGGGTAGYRAYILHVPKHDLSIVTLGNQESFNGLLIAYQLVDLLLVDHLQESVIVKTTYTTDELKSFEGTYKFQPGSYWTIRADEHNLYFGDDSNPLPLIGDGKFTFIYLPASYLTFYPNSMDFRIADFTYHCKKVILDKPIINVVDLKKYEGIYRNEEWNTFYELSIEDNSLVAKHSVNDEITLQPLTKFSFFSPSPFFGELDFKFSLEGKVSKFELSGQGFKKVEFIKLK